MAAYPIDGLVEHPDKGGDLSDGYMGAQTPASKRDALPSWIQTIDPSA